MKVSLVVATGAHEGRVIPLTGAQFLIGRDPQCNLRPASPAISKVHCAVVIRDGRVYVKDHGSTNGTLVNDQLVQGAEVVIQDGATLRVGPLDFRVRVEKLAPK
ncbi:MAG: FHA domain-containing protein, partial [Gemmataceae bacterium]|nr:FHA domain-containing protein [Gemmataceae bacterium]